MSTWSCLLINCDRYIGNTHSRGQVWDNLSHRNNWQLMTIGDQSVPMFHDEFTHQIHLALGSIGHPYSTNCTIQGSVPFLSLMRPGPFSITLLDQTNNPSSGVTTI